MRKKIFKGSSRARYCNHFFQHCFHSPINYTNPYLHLAELFFPLFFSTMQYQAISNAVNCFCSQIKHYLNFLSWASLSFMQVAGGRGVDFLQNPPNPFHSVGRRDAIFNASGSFLVRESFTEHQEMNIVQDCQFLEFNRAQLKSSLWPYC